jgi:hypothetical protein
MPTRADLTVLAAAGVVPEGLAALSLAPASNRPHHAPMPSRGRPPAEEAARLRAAVLASPDLTSTALAEKLGITPQRVRQIRGVADVVTPTSKRGQALVARLLELARKRGVEPEDVLADLERKRR